MIETVFSFLDILTFTVVSLGESVRTVAVHMITKMINALTIQCPVVTFLLIDDRSQDCLHL